MLRIHNNILRQSTKTRIYFIQCNYRSIVGSQLRNLCNKDKHTNSSPNFVSLPTIPYTARHFSRDRKKLDDPASPTSKSKMGMFATAGLAASMLFGKAKYVFVALKLTKMAPLASMVISSFAYSFIFGWPYAVGMVGLIFFHECGHALVMKRFGVPFSPMVFVPFMGAVIVMKDKPRNVYDEALIAFGGPVAGSAAALGTGMVGVALDSQLLIALADFGYMVNLFNLLPIGSLDGGRIGSAISPWIGVAGLAGGGALIYTSAISNPIFYLIMLSGTYTTTSRLLGWDKEEGDPQDDYHKTTRTQQTTLLTGYVALVAALLYAIKENDKLRKTPKELRGNSEGDGSDPKGDGVYDDYFGKSY